MKRLNTVFALSAVAALVSMSWMLWHDYNRPWRHTQVDYFNVRSAMAHADWLQYQSPDEQKRHEQLRDAVRNAESELKNEENEKKLSELQKKEKYITGKSQGVAIDYGNKNAELQVKLFNLEEAKTIHGPDDPKTIALRDDYEKSAAEVARLKKEQDSWEDQLRDTKSQLKQMNAKLTDAKKTLAAYEKGIADAERLDKMYGPGPKRAVFNMPGMDFLAPKGVPGREEVKQVFMKNIRFNYNFLDSYVTDRCTTCHVSIDDPAFSLASFVRKLESSMKTERVGEVVRAENDKLAQQLAGRLARVDLTDLPGDGVVIAKDAPEADRTARRKERFKYVNRVVYAASEFLGETRRPPIGADEVLSKIPEDQPLTRGRIQDEVEKAFRMVLAAAPPRNAASGPMTLDEMSEPQKMHYVSSLVAAMNMYLKKEGRPAIDYREELRAHPRLDLYLSPNSPHPIKKMGCTVCHEGSGQETDFVFAAHTPKNHDEEHEWMRKYYVTELGVPLATFELVEEFWERPMLLPGYTSASCRKCHQQSFDLEKSKMLPVASAKRLIEGRDLFTQVGCINCHNVEGLTDSRRVGTDLTHVADKLSAGFMERWIEYPKNFRPSTWMPHFFHQENNLPSSQNEFDPDPILRSKVEVAAMTHYIRTFSKPIPRDDWHPVPAGMEGDAARGEKLFTSIGCLACHSNIAAKDPKDSEGRTLGERWITTDLEMREGLSKEDAKKRFDAMSKNDQVRYGLKYFTEDERQSALKRKQAEEIAADAQQRDPDPRKLYLPPILTRDAPELSGVGTKLVDDPNDAQQVARAREWIYNWLREPRHYSSYTKMPRLFREDYYWNEKPEDQRKKNDQDMLDIGAFLLSLRNDEFKPEVHAFGEPEWDEMRRLIMMLLTGQNTESVSRRIMNDEKTSPEDPYGRLTAAIVSQVTPSFGEGDAAKQKVMDLISERSGSLESRQELYFGMKMVSHYGCYSCHTIAGFEDATRPGTDLTLWAQKFMSQLDFAFYSPVFEHEWAAKPEVFGHIYLPDEEHAHLVRDSGGNPRHEVLHNHASFAYHKMMNPRIWDREKIKKPYEKLKMPNFYVTEEQARSLTTWLLSMRDPNVQREVQIKYEDSPAGKIARGRALVRELNCIGCHNIEGMEANIHQYYSDDPGLNDLDPISKRFKPPLLWGEGSKIQFAWLFKFLNNVEMLRPWLLARMPSFHLTKEQTTTLVEYFAGLSQYESGTLSRELDPVLKHLRQVHSGATDANAAWFLDPKFEVQKEFLKDYGIQYEQARAGEFAVAGKPADEVVSTLNTVYGKMVEKAKFLASVYNVKYPFSDPNLYTTSEPRYEAGKEFFMELKCLACHVAGDPNVPGTTKDIKAPNFALTHERLRHEWVMNWLRDPQTMMPGTNMPQIFPGTSFFAAYPDDVRKEKEKKFGSTMQEQGSLLVDFLYNLGEKGATVVMPIDPNAAAETPGQTPAGEFDFEGGGATSQPTSQPAGGGLDF